MTRKSSRKKKNTDFLQYSHKMAAQKISDCRKKKARKAVKAESDKKLRKKKKGRKNSKKQ